MPYYTYSFLNEQGETATIDLLLRMGEAEDNLIKDGKALKRVYSPPVVKNGLTAVEKRAGTTDKRVEVGEFTKEQRRKRKEAYDPSSREAVSNELWLGNEGKDGVTEIAVDDHVKRVSLKKEG